MDPLSTAPGGAAPIHSALWYAICILLVGLILVLVHESTGPKTSNNEDPSISAIAPLVFMWITISGGLTWVNKLIFAPVASGGCGFPFVTFLMLWHMFLAVVFTNIIRFTAPELMPAVAQNKVTFRMYMKNIAPVGICLAGSLVLSNAAYVFISVGYIQMVKSCTSSIVYMVAVLVGEEIFCIRCGASLLLICTGVAAASVGELDFNIFGFSLQVTATFIEAVRLIVLKALVSSNGIQLDAMSGLYYYAPTCLVATLVPFSLRVEGAIPWDKVWALHPVLLASALIAFALHLTILVFLRHASSTTYAATGILKDVLLIGSTSVYYSHPVTGIQAAGYGVSLLGLRLFNYSKEMNARLAKQKAQEIAEESTPILQKSNHQV
eukprot:CAMPEP_0172677804 /NCGR_PEP_ID=MMETSP1074-20121228/14934_1 /TAXON_ID=2916 /ORGANISM="Ceratium fusus, Strain PA161109" /LENGTH=379 /DNA_ID=CAMNT_0013495705 /DNA_START=35 /DNA_END=1174 /DNA_ORIENTATION=+